MYNTWPPTRIILNADAMVRLLPGVSFCFAIYFLSVPALAVEFESHVKPLLESTCVRCHNADNAEGGLRLDSRAAAIKGGDNGPALKPGKPLESALYTTAALAEGEDEAMPPDGPPLAEEQLAALKAWIEDGAKWPEKVKVAPQPRMLFAKHVQPVLEQNCVSCHRADNAEGGLDLSTRKAAMAGGDSGAAIVPFQPAISRLYTLTVLDKSADELMPPSNAGGPLKRELTAQLYRWIEQGAAWPADITLKPKAKPDAVDTPDNFQLIKKIHEKIVATAAAERAKSAVMKSYSSKVPKTGADYHMVATPGGEFLMGSPEKEPYRTTAEGPQTKVKVEPFWIGKFEVTWDEYEPFMITQVDREKHGARIDFDPQEHGIVDAVSQPTKPYTEMSFGMGQRGYPAISMTQHAANKYCQWLSAQTGHFYRLPTEAEWEYACRAGTKTAYSFGDDEGKLGEYAWYYDNANEKYQKVGLKKPNPWGIHDMHGNVMEWTADRYEPEYFKLIAKTTANPLLKPTRIYPRSVRGGGWDDDPDKLRSAARRGSAKEWKAQDPQLPKSLWYHTNARWLGFRIVRPLKTPTVEEMDFYWNSATGKR